MFTQRADQTDKEALLARMAERGGATVEVDEWVHADDYAETGHIVRSRWKTVKEVRNEILVHLGSPRPEWDYVSDDVICKAPEDGGFGMEGLTAFLDVLSGYSEPSNPWPDGRIVVFAIRGGSEGDWVHVEVEDRDGRKPNVCVLLAKTFSGRDAAWRFARVLADLLGA